MTVAGAEPPRGDVAPTGDRFYRHVIVLALVAVLLALVYALVRPFFSSLVWALLLSFLLSPLNRRVRKLYRGKKGWASLTVTLAVLFCLALPTAFIAANFVVQGIDLVERISAAERAGGLLHLPWVIKVSGWI